MNSMMNHPYTVEVYRDLPSYIRFTLLSSPNSNNINFIKNNKNKITKREYAIAEVYLDNKIEQHITDYFLKQEIDIAKIAYLSYIKIIKIKYNIKNNKTLKTFTKVNVKNTNKTYKRNKYRNKTNIYNESYTLSKGYGKILLKYVENYLKSIGIDYLVLVPSVKQLINYYIKEGYTIEYIPNNSININENEYYIKHNRNYVSQYMIMYKKL